MPAGKAWSSNCSPLLQAAQDAVSDRRSSVGAWSQSQRAVSERGGTCTITASSAPRPFSVRGVYWPMHEPLLGPDAMYMPEGGVGELLPNGSAGKSIST